jgi:hypothetical protein
MYRITFTSAAISSNGRREKVGNLEPNGGEHGLNVAPGEAMNEGATIIEFANRKRGPAIIVRRTAREPSAAAGLLYAIEAREQRVGTHSRPRFHGRQGGPKSFSSSAMAS